MNIEKRLAEINAREPEPASTEDLAAIAAAADEEAEPLQDVISEMKLAE